MIGEIEFVPQRHDLVVGVTGPHEGERDVLAAQHMDDVVGRTHCQVDPVLRSHHADVGHQVAATTAKPRDRSPPAQPVRVRSGPHHADVGATLATPAYRDLRVGGVGRDDAIRGAERRSLQSEQAPARQPAAVREARVVQLRAEIMVIEDEAGAVPVAKPPRDRPEDVRRVAGLDDIEPAGSPGSENEPRRGHEGVHVLQDEPEGAAAGGVGAVLQQGDPVQHFAAGVALTLRADDGDVVARRRQRTAFQPDPAVEGYRQVLDDDQDTWLPPPGVLRLGHTAQPIPS